MQLDLKTTQEAFKRALMAGQDAAIMHCITPRDKRAGLQVNPMAQLSVYKNNVFASLIEALGDSFPITKKILGEQVFARVAEKFIRLNPPDKPQLFSYGAEFSEYLRAHPISQSYPFMGDLAGLEFMRIVSYFGPGSDKLDPNRLRQISPDDYPSLKFVLHPTFRKMTARYAVFDIWQKGEKQPVPMGPQHIIAVRPDELVITATIDAGYGAFLDSVAQGNDLTLASDAACAADPKFDLSKVLADALEVGLFSDLITKEKHDELPSA